jgi:Cu/Zn superoxide dismutase
MCCKLHAKSFTLFLFFYYCFLLSSPLSLKKWREKTKVLSPEKDIGGGAIDGTITFQEGTTPSTTTGQPAVPYTRISYFFTGMKPGPHKLHVHANGDIQSGDVDYVGGHFTGSTTTVPVRPGVINKKVAYLQNGLPIVADKDGNCVGSFVDNTVGLLDGVNGIMGRSIVIHSPVDGSKVAQGVIGISGEYSLGGSFKATTNTAINWLTDAVKVMNGARQTETATSDGAGTKVPFVLSATCVFKRGGRAPTVDPSTKQVSQDQTIAGTITFASSMENKDVQKTTQAIYKSSNYRTVNPVVDVTWAISGSNFTDSKYTWNVEELGDLTETNSNPSGVFVGSGVHRNSARAVMGKIAETDLLDPTA